MTFKIKSLSCALMLFLSMGSYAEDEGSDWLYTVQEGDSVWTLCKAYVTDPLCWINLVEHNQIKKPKYLPPGSTIKLPRAWLKLQGTTAKVISVNGEVLLHEKAKNTQQPLILNKELAQGDQVETRIGSATLKFMDGSKLQLASHTLIDMQTLLYSDYQQRIDTRINLARGRVRALVEKIKTQGSHYEIITPAAIAAVRGTDFRVASVGDNNQVMITEVVQGRVNVANDFGEQQLPAGFAIKAVVGQALPKPVSLLPRVKMIESSSKKKSVVFPMVFNWQAMKGAVTYKVQLFKVQETEKLLLESQLMKPSYSIEKLPEGEYLLKIRAQDQWGIEGFDRRIKLNLKKNPAFSTEE